MPYEITYTATDLPTDLPEGATVKEVTGLPLSFDTESGEGGVYVSRSASMDGVYLNADSALLNLTEARRVRDALDEALGEIEYEEDEDDIDWNGFTEPPSHVIETEDRDGTHWYRQEDGLWSMKLIPTQGHPWLSLAAIYGPHKAVAFA